MRFLSLLPALAALVVATPSARAHFLWLVTQPADTAKTVQLFFGEEAAPDDPELLDMVKDAEVWAIGNNAPQRIRLKKSEDCYEGDIPTGQLGSPLVVKHTFGILERDETFLLEYYGKTYSSAVSDTWKAVDDVERLPLEVIPSITGSELTLTVKWKGKAVRGSEVTIVGPGIDEPVKQTTNDDGQVVFDAKQAGLYAIRARHMEDNAGEHNGKKYESIRHHSTLSLRIMPKD